MLPEGNKQSLYPCPQNTRCTPGKKVSRFIFEPQFSPGDKEIEGTDGWRKGTLIYYWTIATLCEVCGGCCHWVLVEKGVEEASYYVEEMPPEKRNVLKSIKMALISICKELVGSDY